MAHIYGIDAAAQSLEADVRQLVADVVAPAAAAVDAEARFPAEAMQALAERGFYGLCLPEKVGGKGQPPRTFAAVVEQLAQGCASTAMVYVMHVAATQAIAQSPVLADLDDLLKSIAAGQHLTTLAFSERGSRSQFWAPVSQLEAADGGFVTSAEKSWVTSAAHAESYLCSAQQPAAESPLDSTLYLARTGSEQVRINGGFDGLGLRGNDSSPVSIENLSLSAGDLVTRPGEGAAMMLEQVLPWFCIGTAAMAHGLCLAAIDATRQHLTTAKFDHDGSRLRDLPNLRARIAEMSARTEQSRALLGYTLGEIEQPNETTPLLVLQARLAALQAALDVTDLAMKACGGAAFSKHLAIERMFRDARAGWVMAPTTDHLKEFVGRALTGLPLF